MMELELEKRVRDEGIETGIEQGRIQGTIITGRILGFDDDRVAVLLQEGYGLSREEALKEIWKYDHPEAQGQEPAFNI